MSASVWHEEVYAGFREEIQKTVRIKNAKGELVPLPKPEKSIVVRKPEEDFKFEVFPCVSIYIKDYKHDPFRYDPRPTYTNVQGSRTLEVEECAVPFNLAVQIDFWARFQEDMDAMTHSWLMKHFRQFNLSVVDSGGTPRTQNTIAVGTIVKSDLVLNKERLFHSIANYSIWVEIDDEVKYNVPMVETVDINAHQT